MKPKIVQFDDNTYGIRFCIIPFIFYKFLCTYDTNMYWDEKETINMYCKFTTLEQAQTKLQEYNEKKKPLKYKIVK
jgi:hypothetical protein